MNWTPERIIELRQHFDAGLSAAQTASVMGGGLSRNAIISKWHRSGWPARGNDYIVSRKSQASDAPRHVHRKSHAPKAPNTKSVALFRGRLPLSRQVKLPALVPLPHLVFFEDLQAGTCKYAIGEQEGKHHFCGHRANLLTAWCEHHRRIVYRPFQSWHR